MYKSWLKLVVMQGGDVLILFIYDGSNVTLSGVLSSCTRNQEATLIIMNTIYSAGQKFRTFKESGFKGYGTLSMDKVPISK